MRLHTLTMALGLLLGTFAIVQGAVAAGGSSGPPTATAPVEASAASAAKRIPIKLEGKESLPLRVLSRAFSKVYKTPDVASSTIEENVPAFQAH